MRSMLTRTETRLLAFCAALLVMAVLGPTLAQPDHHHHFADQRTLWGIPFAMDVLSNLPFALAGLAGAWCLRRLPARAISNVQRAMSALFFGGLLLTAAASSWYHGLPDDAGLVLDRCGMAVAFAGLLGLATAVRVSERAGACMGLAVLLLGPLSVQVWSATGNVLPWATVQFGGMALVLWLACLRQRHGALVIRWGVVILAYAVAKMLELHDHDIFHLTGQLVSGHTLKHAVAALAAVPMVAAFWRLGNSRQNAFASSTPASTQAVATRRAGHA